MSGRGENIHGENGGGASETFFVVRLMNDIWYCCFVCLNFMRSILMILVSGTG